MRCLGVPPLSLALAMSFACVTAPQIPDDDYLEAARQAARWIEASERQGPAGIIWPIDPLHPEHSSLDLYSGSAGVVLFLVELHLASGDPGYLARAQGGADALADAIDSTDSAGLYTGLAGTCWVLGRVARVGGDPRHEKATSSCLTRLRNSAVRAGRGVEWNDTTDIIGGSAGIGLVLLWAAEERNDGSALAVATAAGDRLLELGVPAPPGMKWAMTPDFPRLMPNFSHGTAGIAYFLAVLHRATGEPRFLQAALAGGRYLQSIASTEGDVCLIVHHEPADEELYYLSWCHGPAGTARTFWLLWQLTGDDQWRRYARMSAAAILRSGIPETRTPGFWNNVGQCCGNAGVVEFFLDLYGELGDAEYLAFARRIADDALARATRDDSGLRWLQAEHRVQPDNLVAQTGWMQGAAGMGGMLLRLRAAERGVAAPRPLPDSPFARVWLP